MKKLKKTELNQLRGGTDDQSDGPVENINNATGCYCYFNNTSKVTNTNNVSNCNGCKCKPAAGQD
jgi:hypothetical protein